MTGRTALVTGSSRGIGAAVADIFRRRGGRVLAPGRDAMDLSDDASLDAYVDGLAEPVDILVNSAGVNIPGGLAEASDRAVRDTLQVNLVAPLRLARALSRGMSERRYGRILNVGSIWGAVYRERRLAYAVSKSGVPGLTRALAVELAPFNVLVNALAPGYVDTEMTRRNNSPESLEAIRRSIPLGRLGDPAEVAEFAAFLCSGANTYMTGQTLILDGGYTCL